MKVIANTKEFDDVLASGKKVLVDFYADWCGPCKMLAPVLENLANEVNDVEIVKVNVDLNNELAARYGVMSIPTLIVFENGQKVNQSVGFMPLEQLKQLVK